MGIVFCVNTLVCAVCCKIEALSQFNVWAVTVKTEEQFLSPGALLTLLSTIHFHLLSLIFSYATCLIMDSSFKFDVPPFLSFALKSSQCFFLAFSGKQNHVLVCVYKGLVLPCNFKQSDKECRINLYDSANFITLSPLKSPQAQSTYYTQQQISNSNYKNTKLCWP